MKKYFVIDKANSQTSIFILVKDEIDNSYRFIDTEGATLIIIKFETYEDALAWLNIGYTFYSLNS